MHRRTTSLVLLLLALGLSIPAAYQYAELRYLGRVGISSNNRNLFTRRATALTQPRVRTVPGYVRNPRFCNGKCDNKVVTNAPKMFSENPIPTMSPQTLNSLNNLPSISSLLKQTEPGTYNTSIAPNVPIVDMQAAAPPQFSLPNFGKAPTPMGQLHSPGGGGKGGGGGGPGGGRGGPGGGAGAGGNGGANPQATPSALTPDPLRRPTSFGDTSTSPQLASVTPSIASSNPGMKGDVSQSPSHNFKPYLPPSTEKVGIPQKWNFAFRTQKGEEVFENLCGGAPVAKRKDSENSCSYAFLTADHCVEQEFYQMRLQRAGDPYHQMLSGDGVKVERGGSRNDVALIYFAATCDLVPDNEVGRLADVNPDGTTQFDHQGSVGMINQDGNLITGNINPGLKFEGSNNLVADITSGPEARKGDSGSFIFDSTGHIIGTLSGGSKNRNDFSFSPHANQWALERLAINQFFKPVNENPYPSLAGQKPTGQPLQMPDGRRPSQIASSTPIHQNFNPARNGRFEDRLIGSLPQELHGAGQVCVACHNRPENKEQVPAGVKNLDSLGTHLASMSDSNLDTMLKRSNLSPHDEAAMRDYVKKARAMVQTSASRGVSSQIAACYMSAEEQTRKTNQVPMLQPDSLLGARLADAQNNGRMMFFDKGSVPRVWQRSKIIERDGQMTSDQKLLTERNTSNPDMYQRMGYHSDGAREHPWAHSAGMDISPNGSADKFVIPPADGPLMRLVNRSKQSHPEYFGTSRNVNGPQMGYEYAVGTMFGEVLKVSGVPFEIRLRMKNGAGEWVMDVLRPFQNMGEFATRLVELCKGSDRPASCSQAEGKIQSLMHLAPQNMQRNSFINAGTFGTTRDPLSLNSPAADATVRSADMQWIPDLPTDLVKAALSKTPFKSVFDKPWTTGANPSWAPTTQSDFSIVPKNFFGGLVPMNTQSCTKCHDSAGRHVDNFDPTRNQMYAPAPNDAPRPRTWYNNIPGDDNILSFHPWSKQAVESGARTDRNALNDCLVRNGLVQ